MPVSITGDDSNTPLALNLLDDGVGRCLLGSNTMVQ